MKICPKTELCDSVTCRHKTPHEGIMPTCNARYQDCPECVDYKEPVLFTCPIHGEYDSTRHVSKGCHFCIDNGLTVEVDTHAHTSVPTKKQVGSQVDSASIILNKAFADRSGTPTITDKEESDPHGIPTNEPGAKLDAGKVRVGMMLDQFAHALWAVAEVSTYGATKYSEGGWLEVSDGEARYNDAESRHRLKKGMGEEYDVESGLLHDAHKAWNALAQLEKKLRREKK